MDHLGGEGEWADPKEQIRALSKGVLDKIRKAIVQAFNLLPSLDPPVSFADIKQLPDERFMDFVNQMKTVLEKEVDDPSLHARLLFNRVKANANAICQQVIVGLPIDPPPTLTTIIEACSAKVPILTCTKEERKKQTSMSISAAATPTLPPPLVPRQPPTCFRCSLKGHLVRNCPAPNPKGAAMPNKDNNKVDQKKN